jgi:hypothetical protein
MHAQRLHAALLILLLLALPACKRDTETSGDGEASDTQANKEKKTGRVIEEIAWKSARPEVDRNLLSQLDAVAQSCDFESGRPTRCNENQAEEARKALEARGLEALGTWAVALSSSEPELHDYAAWSIQELLVDERFEAIAEAPNAIEEQALTRLLEVFEKSDAYTSARVARVVTHAAMLGEQSEELLAVLEKHPHRETRVQAYRASMKFGRLRPMDQLITLSQDKNQERLLRQAALRAPLEMLPFENIKERDQVCSWVADFLSEKDSMLEEWPARLMPHCGESHIDALLDQTQDRIDGGNFSPAFGETLTSFCTPKTPELASPKQCERLASMLRDVAMATSLDPATRAQAIRLLGAHTPDPQTLRVIEKIAKEPGTPDSVRAAALQVATPMRENLARP